MLINTVLSSSASISCQSTAPKLIGLESLVDITSTPSLRIAQEPATHIVP
jgi:hypothetical protein